MTKLEDLRMAMSGCDKCQLCMHRSQIVFGDGKVNGPAIMIIGEAPGADEDEAGLPFVGRCGQKLNEILAFAGIKRESIYIANSVMCRPPNNRPPTMEEILACRERLLIQIQEIKPRLIVTMGRIAIQALIGKELKGPLSQLFAQRFHDITINGKSLRFVATYHPSYLLRNRKVAFPIMFQHWKDIKDEIKL